MPTLPGPIVILPTRLPGLPQVFVEGGIVDIQTVIAGSYDLSAAKLQLRTAALDTDPPALDLLNPGLVNYSDLVFTKGLAKVVPPLPTSPWTLLPTQVYWVDLLYDYVANPTAYVRSNPIWGADLANQEISLVGQVDKAWAGRVVQVSLTLDYTLNGKTYLKYGYDAEVSPLGAWRANGLPRGRTCQVTMPDGTKKSVTLTNTAMMTYTA